MHGLLVVACSAVLCLSSASGPGQPPATPGLLGIAGPSAAALAGPVAGPAQAANPRGELGSVTVSGFTFTISQDSAVVPGREADFSLVQTAGTGSPRAVRLWIGIESAEGSVKARAHRHGDRVDAHVEVPDPLPPGSRLWVEVETADGRRAAASIEFRT